MTIAGVDEVGRGPLAGPVLAAAVILDPQYPIEGLADSKQLTAKKRSNLTSKIKKYALAWAVGQAEVEEIYRHNILQATLIAMKRAVDALDCAPELVLIDGLHAPLLPCPTQTVVRGDKLFLAISAASILAKVTRDKLMQDLDLQYPEYGFAQHKGYGTIQHRQALKQYGYSPVHRRSFSPVNVCAPNPIYIPI